MRKVTMFAVAALLAVSMFGAFGCSDNDDHRRGRDWDHDHGRYSDRDGGDHNGHGPHGDHGN